MLCKDNKSWIDNKIIVGLNRYISIDKGHVRVLLNLAIDTFKLTYGLVKDDVFASCECINAPHVWC